MHERAVMADLVREVESVAASQRARRVTGVQVRLGALSHFTPAHFREHFEDAVQGTLAEGAQVDAELRTDPTSDDATGVVLESVELEW